MSKFDEFIASKPSSYWHGTHDMTAYKEMCREAWNARGEADAEIAECRARVSRKGIERDTKRESLKVRAGEAQTIADAIRALDSAPTPSPEPRPEPPDTSRAGG